MHRGSPGLKQTGKFGSRRSEHFECPREILFGTGIRFIATLQLGQLSIEFGKPLLAKLSEKRCSVGCYRDMFPLLLAVSNGKGRKMKHQEPQDKKNSSYQETHVNPLCFSGIMACEVYKNH